MTHKLSKTRFRFDSTPLLFVIFVLNVGNRLDPKWNIRPLINLLFNPEYWRNMEYFSNSKALSSYSPKFELILADSKIQFAECCISLKLYSLYHPIFIFISQTMPLTRQLREWKSFVKLKKKDKNKKKQI